MVPVLGLQITSSIFGQFGHEFKKKKLYSFDALALGAEEQ